MFARIAGRYDLMNRVMSFGMDGMWRREIARLALRSEADAQTLVLDVGTGTGMIAQEIARRGPQVIALDYTPEMMYVGRDEGGVGNDEPVYFAAGDALRLPFGDETFGAVTTGFMMRNVTDIEGAFREMARVLQPGGRLVCLEVGRPRFWGARLFHRVYTRKVVPLLGRLIAGDGDAYTYLPSSMGRFPAPPELAQIMRRAGLRRVRFKQMSFGAVALHWGEKREPDQRPLDPKE
jgi:demethylmenaquinone methyltransferase / 2-methoxy-6-polyprenyl-1,4-benzoquinol methylase